MAKDKQHKASRDAVAAAAAAAGASPMAGVAAPSPKQHKGADQLQSPSRHHHHHNHDGGAQPATKRCKVEVTAAPLEAKQHVPPVAVYFPAGQAPKEAKLSLYEAGPSAGRGAQKFVLAGSQGNVCFVGRTHGEEYSGFESSACRQALAVHDRTTGQLHLLPLAGDRIIRMEPRLPGLNYDTRAAAAAAQDDEMVMDGAANWEQTMADNKRLVDSFGSTRRRRQLTAREEGVVRLDKLGESAQALSMLVGHLGEQAQKDNITKQSVLAQANAFRHLPPHNLEAKLPEQAYPVAQLLPPEVAISLRPGLLLKAAEEAETLESLQGKHTFNEYVLARVPLLVHPQGNEQARNKAKHRAKLLAFLNVLMRLKVGRPVLRAESGGLGTGLSQLAKNLGTSPDVLEPLLNLFYDRGTEDGVAKYSRDKSGETLLQAYICVAALMLEPDYLVAAQQMATMAEVLKMAVGDLAQRFRDVGALVKAAVVKRQGGPSGEEAAADGSSGAAGAPLRSFTARLLPDGHKTLQEYLPAVKLLARSAKK